MTEKALSGLLDRACKPGSRVVWVDSMAYGRRLFAGGRDVWAEPGQFIELTRQAQRLLGSEVIEVRLDSFYRAALAADPSLGEPLRGRRLSVAVRRLLGHEAPTARAVESSAALQALFPETPIVVVIAGGAGWLNWAAGALALNPSLDPDDVDATAMYLADALRGFASVGVSGMVLDLRGQGAIGPMSQLIELHRPLLNLARHYDWRTGAQVDPTMLDDASTLAGDLDVVLCADLELSTVGEPRGDVVLGGGLNDRFWRGETFCEMPDRGLYYGEIPVDAEPEGVLDRLARVRAGGEAHEARR